MKVYIKSSVERTFRSTEDGELWTVSDLKYDFECGKKDGEIDDDVPFGGYLRDCTSLNGFLEEVDAYGVLTQDNYTAHLNILVFRFADTANKWYEKLLKSPTRETFEAALKHDADLLDDALADSVGVDRYYTDASGYSNESFPLTNTKPIVIS